MCSRGCRSCWSGPPRLTPLVLFLVYRSDPELAVRIANGAKTWGMRALVALAVIGIIAALLFPPVPAWIRLMFERTRTAWSVDRAPLLRAMSELQHLETAQRHLEVGRLAWTRTDYSVAGRHLQRAVELDATIPAARYLFGLYLLRVGAVAAALAELLATEQLEPGHAFGSALCHIGRCQDLIGTHDAAVTTLLDHRDRHGGDRRSHYWLGEALLHANREAEARDALRTAAEPTDTRLTAEENWYRAVARVRLWRLGGRA